MATQTQERRLAFLATALPPIVWVVVFFLAPLAIVWAYSFGQNAGLTEVDISGTFANYCARSPAALSRHLRQVDLRGRPHHFALSHRRLSGGARHRVRQRALAAVDAAVGHAAVLDQSLIRTYALIAVLRTEGYVNFTLEWLWNNASWFMTLVGLQPLGEFTAGAAALQ